MKQKTQGVLLAILVVVISVCLVLNYLIGPEQLGDPVMVKYLIEVVLYPSALLAIILTWKLTLDKKIRSKQQRKADLDQIEKQQ